MTRRWVLCAALVLALLPAARAGASSSPSATSVTALQQLVAGLTSAPATSKQLDGTQIINAVPTRFGILAAGVTDGRLSLWTSKDGQSFTRVPDAQVEGAPDLADPNVLPVLPMAASAKVAVVMSGTDAWTTADGRTFTHSTSPANGLLLGDQGPVAALHLVGHRPVAAAADTKRIVAVGSSCWCTASGQQSVGVSYEGRGDPQFVPTAWVSPDAVKWTGAPIAQAGSPAADATAVVAPAGGYVMAGRDQIDPLDTRNHQAAVWHSSDGASWTAVLGSATGPHTEIDRVAALGKTVVASGTDSTSGFPVATVWRSTDSGSSWARVPTDAGVFGLRSHIDQLVATPSGFIATGTLSGQPNGGSTVWLSADGSTWAIDTTADTKLGLPDLMLWTGRSLVGFHVVDAQLVPPGQSYVVVSTPSRKR